MKYFMKRFAPAAVTSALILAACATGPISGSADSGVRNLDVGMTEGQVLATIGPTQAAVTKGDVTCRSHVYDEVIGAKYVHVYYRDGRVFAANDGHRKPCDLG